MFLRTHVTYVFVPYKCHPHACLVFYHAILMPVSFPVNRTSFEIIREQSAKKFTCSKMHRFLVENSDIQRVPNPSETNVIRPHSVGEDLGLCVQRMEWRDRHQLHTVVTYDQWIQQLRLAEPEIHSVKTVLLNIYPSTNVNCPGTLTVSTLFGTVIAVPLQSFMRNQRVDLREAMTDHLSEILSLMANPTVTKFVGSKEEWSEMMASIGLDDVPLINSYDKKEVVANALASGRISPNVEGLETPRELIAALVWSYEGKSLAPVSEEEYQKAFPGENRPPSRDSTVLLDWPQEMPDSPPFATLDQVDYILSEEMAFSKSIVHLAADRVTVPELAESSDETPLTTSKIYYRNLAQDEAEDESPLWTFDYSVDGNRFGPKMTGLLKEIKAAKKLFRHYFGQVCLGEVSLIDAPLGLVIRVNLLGKACSQCGEMHDINNPPCELSRRMIKKEVDLDEVNCVYCFGHDHTVKPCPVLHNRCKICGHLGHLAEFCKSKTTEEHLRRFLAYCGLGMFTSLERRGPLLGPFGFGSGLKFVVSRELNLQIQEVSVMLYFKHKYASRGELQRRRDAVQFAMPDAKRQDLFYLEMKAEGESWASYLARQRRPLRDRKSLGPYRGTSALLLDTIDRESGLSERETRRIHEISGGSVNASDLQYQVAKIEEGKREAKARRSKRPSPNEGRDPSAIERSISILKRDLEGGSTSPALPDQVEPGPLDLSSRRTSVTECARCEAVPEVPGLSVADAKDLISKLQESHLSAIRALQEEQIGKSRDQVMRLQQEIRKLNQQLGEREGQLRLDRHKLEEDMIHQLKQDRPDIRTSSIIRKLRAVLGENSVMAPALEAEMAREGNRREPKDTSGKLPIKGKKRKSHGPDEQQTTKKSKAERSQEETDMRKTITQLKQEPKEPGSSRQTRSKTGRRKIKKPYTPDPSDDEDGTPRSRSLILSRILIDFVFKCNFSLFYHVVLLIFSKYFKIMLNLLEIYH